MATLILTDKFKEILERQEVVEALSEKGYDSLDSFLKEILKRINNFDASLNLKSISYHTLQDTDTYIGVILDEYLNKLYNICVIPPKLGTRSGFLSQQIFGFISNLINGSKTNNPLFPVDKPVIVVNCLVENLTDSAICNIIGAKIIGFNYIDIFNRQEDFGAPNSTLAEFINTISKYKKDIFKDIEFKENTLVLKTERLKDFKESLTNEPYYFAITAYPAVILAKKEGYKIDITNFEDKLNNGKSNKNINAFVTFVKKLQTIKIPIPTILYGPPGTGKTHKMQKDYISKYNNNEDVKVVTFHQSYSYEEFVEGLKPVLDKDANNNAGNNADNVKYTIEKGIFYEACERAAKVAGYGSLKECIDDTIENRCYNFKNAIADNKTVLLCIDEINRGNVASIFGDLISLIEPSKRLGAGELEMTAILPYSKELFGVPANLFIVGTMNTADRSIQLLDSALRRRFKFEELLPNPDVIENDRAKNVLENINARVRCLLNKDNQIGHSYLMHAKNSCDILSALYNKIIPLLEEYFYNDISKVRFVLNDLKNAQFYVEDTEAQKAYQLYLNEEDVNGEEKKFFKLNSTIADAINSNNESECDKYLVNLLPQEGK